MAYWRGLRRWDLTNTYMHLTIEVREKSVITFHLYYSWIITTHHITRLCHPTLNVFYSGAGRAIRSLFMDRVRPRDSQLPYRTSTITQPPNKTGPDVVQSVPAHNPSEAHPFDTINRVRLIKRIIEGKGETLCGLQCQHLQEKGSLLAYFPLHEQGILQKLADDWLTLHIMPWEQVSQHLSGPCRFPILSTTQSLFSFFSLANHHRELENCVFTFVFLFFSFNRFKNFIPYNPRSFPTHWRHFPISWPISPILVSETTLANMWRCTSCLLLITLMRWWR